MSADLSAMQKAASISAQKCKALEERKDKLAKETEENLRALKDQHASKFASLDAALKTAKDANQALTESHKLAAESHKQAEEDLESGREV